MSILQVEKPRHSPSKEKNEFEISCLLLEPMVFPNTVVPFKKR